MQDNSIRSFVFESVRSGQYAGAVAGEPIGTIASLPPPLVRLSPHCNVMDMDIGSEPCASSVKPTPAHLQHNPHGPCQPFLLDKALVEYYGAETSFAFPGSLSPAKIPRPSQIRRSDKWFDGPRLKAIGAGVIWGSTPTNDGKVIRSTFRLLTKMRRKEFVQTLLQVRRGRKEGKVSLPQHFVVRRIEPDQENRKKGSVTSRGQSRDEQEKVQKNHRPHIAELEKASQ